MNWSSASLEELCEINVGRTPARANPEFWGTGHPWLSIADMNQGRTITATKEQITEKASSSSRVVEPGTVLLSFKLSIGKVAVAGMPLFTNEAIAALPIKQVDRLLPEFLVRALEAQDLTGGSNRAAMGATLNKAKLKRIRIPLPPLDEQQRIAAILDQVDALRARRRRGLAMLPELMRAVYAEMLPRDARMVPLGAALSSAPVFTDGDWVESKDQDPNGEVRLTQLADVGDNDWLDKSSRFLTMEKAADLRCTFLERGDVLVARMPDPLGRACVFPGDEHLCVTVVDVCVIRPDPERFTSEWLAASINSEEVRRQIAGLATGTTRSRVSRGNLKKVVIPDVPLGVQEEFSRGVAKISALRQQMLEAAGAESELGLSLGSMAFRGELGGGRA